MSNDKKFSEVAPPGWSGTVRAMQTKHSDKFDKESKGQGGKINPYALAWSMKNKGAKSHYKQMPGKDSTKGTPQKKKTCFEEWLKENHAEYYG